MNDIEVICQAHRPSDQRRGSYSKRALNVRYSQATRKTRPLLGSGEKTGSTSAAIALAGSIIGGADFPVKCLPSVQTAYGLGMSASPERHEVRSFGDVQAFGDAYRAGRIVDVLLDEAEGDLVRRVYDFAAGAAFVTGGQIERIDRRHLRLTPAGPGGPNQGPSGDREPRSPRPRTGAGGALAEVPLEGSDEGRREAFVRA